MAMSQARELAGRSVSWNCSPCSQALTFANAREWTGLISTRLAACILNRYLVRLRRGGSLILIWKWAKI